MSSNHDEKQNMSHPPLGALSSLNSPVTRRIGHSTNLDILEPRNDLQQPKMKSLSMSGDILGAPGTYVTHSGKSLGLGMPGDTWRSSDLGSLSPSHLHAKFEGLSMNAPSSCGADIIPDYASAHIPPAAIPPEPEGGYLLPNVHEFSQAEPDSILQKMEQILQTLDIDFRCKRDKFKFKCVAYDNGDALYFVGRIYSSPKDRRERGKYVVEIGKRRGCAIHFSEVYRSIMSELGKSNLVDCDILPPRPRLKLEQLDLPEMSEDELLEATQETTNNLIQMASSQCCDVKAEAIRALAMMTSKQKDDKVIDRMLRCGTAITLHSHLNHPYEDIHRNAISGVANCTEGRKNVCETFVQLGMDKIYKLAQSQIMQVKRECARALCNIGSQAFDRVDQQPFRNAVQVMSEQKDQVIQALCQQILQQTA